MLYAVIKPLVLRTSGVKAMLPLFSTNTMVSYLKAGSGSRMSMVSRTVDEPPLFVPVKL